MRLVVMFVENRPTTLREAEKNEYWLQDWICAKPERLGLGQFESVEQELRQ